MSEIKVEEKGEAKTFHCSRCQTENNIRMKYKLALPYRFDENTSVVLYDCLCLYCWFLLKANFKNCVYA